MTKLLLFSVFVIATCGLIYELIMGTLASYLLGDSVTQFSITIGVYLFSMGIGSYLSRFVNRSFLPIFIKVELLIAFIGGWSAATLFILFNYVSSFRIILYLILSLIGILVGLEIPLLMRILKNEFEFKDLISKIFTFDYIGALIASVLFPLLFVPHLGLMRTAFFFGILNALVALLTIYTIKTDKEAARPLKPAAIAIILSLTLGFAYSDTLMSFSENNVYQQNIIFAKTTTYQRLVLTKQQDEIRLYLNGHLQFSSRDEYRYHEALVHVGLQGLPQARSVLVLGGGDGLAVREVLKYPKIESITLVDLDPSMTEIFSQTEVLTNLNDHALTSEKLRIVHEDAFLWLQNNQEKFDFVIVDLPDPTNYSLGKLYTTTFFERLKNAIAPEGAMVIQSTSPLMARKSFWCVDKTLQAVGLQTRPYHAYIPSFGEWGYVLAYQDNFSLPLHFEVPLRFLTASALPALFEFPPDMAKVEVSANRLNNQMLVRYYDEEWSRYQAEEEL